MSDIWTQAAEGGDEQVKQELLAEADRIERFILQAEGLTDDHRFPTRRESRWFIERLVRELYALDGEYPFPNWVSDWYQKANAWNAAGYAPPGEE